MANWGSDANNSDIVNPDLQWRVKVKSIEDNLRKLKQEADNMSQKFIWVKQNNGSFDGFQNWIHKMRESCGDIMRNMEDLVKMISMTHDLEYAAKNTQVKELSKRVNSQMKHIQNLSSDIQKEMEKSLITRRMALSIAPENSGAGDRLSDGSENQIQLSAMSDPEYKEAVAEQQQCDKLLKDILQLEDMMVKVAGMVHDQGETVDKIEANVETAYNDVEKAEQALQKAVEINRSINKKKLFIVIAVLVILALLALIIGLSVKYG